MHVLVTYATRHSATEGIAEAIARVLSREGPAPRVVDLIPVDDVGRVTDYDTVVIGSAVYQGRWLPEARDLVHRCADDLRPRPVWLFSSGPLGEPAVPLEDSTDESDLAEMVDAVSHRTFAGALRRADLEDAERAAFREVHAPEGDFRNWPEIQAWAEEIAATLSSVVAGAARG